MKKSPRETKTREIKKLLVCNRGEIATRIFRACTELDIRTVAMYSYEDRFSLHRFKADEAYQIGTVGKPVQAYLDIAAVVQLAKNAGVDAVHPGYGFLSERAELAQALEKEGIIFIGPTVETLTIAGNKLNTIALAKRAKVPTLPSSALLHSFADAKKAAPRVGFPLMVKAAFGGGGRGMRVCRSSAELKSAFEAAKAEATAAFGRGEVYLEHLVERPKHIEVQLLGDGTGSVVHLFERDCSVQRRHQKVVEVAPAFSLAPKVREQLRTYALALGRALTLRAAATAEFLVAENGTIYFIEINPRIQVEHTVTEEITGVDLVQSQIKIAQGKTLAALTLTQEEIVQTGVAIQVRLTTEDPQKSFAPDCGTLTTYRSASGFGIRLDAGSAYTGAEITPYYDSLLVKITAHARTLDDGARKLIRCLQEFRVRGVKTNIQFLMKVLSHPTFLSGDTRTTFIDETAELLEFKQSKDRANKILRFLGEVTVSGHAKMPSLTRPALIREAPLPPSSDTPIPKGSRDQLKKLGTKKFLASLAHTKQLLITDTTLRDAHQSLVATRLRTADMARVGGYFARHLSPLFSLEMWGGATFDVTMRFLHEDPWERLATLRSAVPNILFQMLIRGSNAVGYKNYPPQVIELFIKEAATSGIDIFRIFDCFNNVDLMRSSIDAVKKHGGIAEVALCYTSDLSAEAKRRSSKTTPPYFDLKYYLSLAKEIERAGADIIAIKDMAGLLRPYAAQTLITALKNETDLPIHLHTHDTAGGQIASYLKAAESGVQIVDCAISSMAGVTSQPSMEALIAALEGTPRDTGLSLGTIAPLADYFETVRSWYAPFESDLKAPTGEVYLTEIPGGQYSNLRPQAESINLGTKWREIKHAYREADALLGRVIKVTPSSKAVGDLALFLVAKELTPAALLKNPTAYTLPSSVLELLRGELGPTPGKLPKELVALAKSSPAPKVPLVTVTQARGELTKLFRSLNITRACTEQDLASYLLFPEVYTEFLKSVELYSDLSILPTPAFLYGLKTGEEIVVDLEPGKRLFISLEAVSKESDTGSITVFFELNGQSRTVSIKGKNSKEISHRRKADPTKPNEFGAPLAGALVALHVKVGDTVKANDPIATFEAMKMQSVVRAKNTGKITSLPCAVGTRVEAGDLVAEITV